MKFFFKWYNESPQILLLNAAKNEIFQNNYKLRDHAFPEIKSFHGEYRYQTL